MSSNGALATKVLRELARLGVREFAVAAGARNAPLIAPLLASEGFVCRNFFDERSAAFFALGRALAEQKPVAIVTTSGTAVGELLPAVMEAHYQGLPLVLVTADRPKSFRASGAPQAVEQNGIFGCYAMPTLDLDAASIETPWPDALSNRPFHINVCFDEPLDCDTPGIKVELPSGTALQSVRRSREAADIATSKKPETLLPILESWIEQRDNLLILVGGLHPSRTDAVARFLRAVNAPIVAEATANLHGVPELSDLLLPASEAVLRQMKATHVIRIGAVPSWRWWRDLEDRPEVSVLNICEPAFPGLARRDHVVTCGFELLDFTCDHCLGAQIPRFDDTPRLDELIESHPLAEPSWMRHLSRAIPDGSSVFLGNSLPIREWNLAAADAKRGTTFFANRGANGIDGIVSTFLGVSAEACESWLVIGDLSTLYDLNAPWILSQLPTANRRIVIINNGGGKIFSRVQSLRSLDDTSREVIENRHTLGFEAWAAMWGMSYKKVSSPAELDALPDGAVVIEIHPDAAQTEQFWAKRNA